MTEPISDPISGPIRIRMRIVKRISISAVKTAGISNPITMRISTGKTTAEFDPGTAWGPLGGGVGLTFWSPAQVFQ
jgi:hypothetical protein